MQYFVVMIDYGRRGREAVVDPEVTRREVVSRIASGEYNNISFIHEIADRSVEDITEEILAEAALPESRLMILTGKPIASIMPATCASTRRFDETRQRQRGLLKVLFPPKLRVPRPASACSRTCRK
jgi:hypothetical protein